MKGAKLSDPCCDSMLQPSARTGANEQRRRTRLGSPEGSVHARAERRHERTRKSCQMRLPEAQQQTQPTTANQLQVTLAAATAERGRTQEMDELRTARLRRTAAAGREGRCNASTKLIAALAPLAAPATRPHRSHKAARAPAALPDLQPRAPHRARTRK